MPVVPANVPAWAYAKAEPIDISCAVVYLLEQSPTLPTPDNINILPNIGNIGLAFCSLSDLERWAESHNQPISRSKHSSPKGGEYYHYSAGFSFMHVEKLYTVRMSYISG